MTLRAAAASSASLGRTMVELLPDRTTAMRMGMVAAAGLALYRGRQFVSVQRPSHEDTMWGFVAIPEGERWNVVEASGKNRSVDGPKVVFALGARFLRLQLFTASHSQYLWIQTIDGKTEIKSGPAAVYSDPSVHKEVKVMQATSLTEHEVLVVYREEDPAPGAGQGERKIARHIIRGPCLHVPKNATEWVHEFGWHGSRANDPDGARKYKNGACFTKLRCCPEQTYFDVEGVRTRDDALVTIKVMIFYRLVDIETMLRETHDPVADFVNALSSDIIELVAGKTFEEFKVSTEKLNDISVYKQLTSRADSIGFKVTKVVFRGYGAPQRLQKMHDDAIERRTKLALERETEDQEQQMQDMKIDREEQRMVKKRRCEEAASEHTLKLKRSAHEAKMREQEDERLARLQQLVEIKEKLGLSGAHLASYLLAAEQGRPEKLIQIIGKEGSGFIHLAEPSGL